MSTVLETYSDCVRETLNYGFNDGPQVNLGRIQKWINEAQQQIARQIESSEFQATDTITLEKGVYKYALPENFLRVQDVYYPEMLGRLKPVDLQQFDQSAPRIVEGPPSIYTIYSTELWVFPTPNNSTDTLELRFIKRPPVLVAEADVPVLNKDYLHLLVEWALYRAYAAEDDQEFSQAHLATYKADLAAYGNDAQMQIVDRPRVVDGTWSTGSGGSGRYFT